MAMEQPEIAPDLVGRTSARLLAAGVDRLERLDALHLLAILDASTDAQGRVRRPLDDLAGEFDLAPVSVMRSLDHLEEVQAVRREGGHVVLLGDDPRGLGGMQLADFLEDVRASFEGAPRADRRSGWIARQGAALVAVAAALAVLMLAPNPSMIDQPLAMSQASTTVVEQTEEPAPTELDPPITGIRPSTTIVPSAVTTPLDTAVAAAETAENECYPITEVADRVDCLIDDDLIGDRDEEVPQGAPVAPEPPAPPPTQELPPAAPEATAPAVTVLDIPPVGPSTEGVTRTFRS